MRPEASNREASHGLRPRGLSPWIEASRPRSIARPHFIARPREASQQIEASNEASRPRLGGLKMRPPMGRGLGGLDPWQGSEAWSRPRGLDPWPRALDEAFQASSMGRAARDPWWLKVKISFFSRLKRREGWRTAEMEKLSFSFSFLNLKILRKLVFTTFSQYFKFRFPRNTTKT